MRPLSILAGYVAESIKTFLPTSLHLTIPLREIGMTLPTSLNEELNNYIQNYLRQHSTQTWIDAEQSSGKLGRGSSLVGWESKALLALWDE